MGVSSSAQTQFLTSMHDSLTSQIVQCLEKKKNLNKLIQLHYSEMSIAPFVCIYICVYLSRCILQLSLCPQFISLHAFTALLDLFFLFLQTVDFLIKISKHIFK